MEKRLYKVVAPIVIATVAWLAYIIVGSSRQNAPLPRSLADERRESQRGDKHRPDAPKVATTKAAEVDSKIDLSSEGIFMRMMQALREGAFVEFYDSFSDDGKIAFAGKALTEEEVKALGGELSRAKFSNIVLISYRKEEEAIGEQRIVAHIGSMRFGKSREEKWVLDFRRGAEGWKVTNWSVKPE